MTKDFTRLVNARKSLIHHRKWFKMLSIYQNLFGPGYRSISVFNLRSGVPSRHENKGTPDRRLFCIWFQKPAERLGTFVSVIGWFANYDRNWEDLRKWCVLIVPLSWLPADPQQNVCRFLWTKVLSSPTFYKCGWFVAITMTSLDTAFCRETLENGDYFKHASCHPTTAVWTQLVWRLKPCQCGCNRRDKNCHDKICPWILPGTTEILSASANLSKRRKSRKSNITFFLTQSRHHSVGFVETGIPETNIKVKNQLSPKKTKGSCKLRVDAGGED